MFPGCSAQFHMFLKKHGFFRPPTSGYTLIYQGMPQCRGIPLEYPNIGVCTPTSEYNRTSGYTHTLWYIVLCPDMEISGYAPVRGPSPGYDPMSYTPIYGYTPTSGYTPILEYIVSCPDIQVSGYAPISGYTQISG